MIQNESPVVAATEEPPRFADDRLLTYSAESVFWSCPRKYFLQYVCGYRPRHTADPLRMGSAFHLGLQLLKSGSSPMQAEQVIRDTYLSQPCPPWLEAGEYDTERETVIAMVKAWGLRWAGDMIVKYVAVEQSFRLPIVNPATGKATPSFWNAGQIDGVASLPDGRLAVVEHKTTSDELAPDSDYWKALLMDNQISRYYLAARGLGFDVSCIVYDVTRKPGIRPKQITKADRAQATSTGLYFGVPLRIAPGCESCGQPMLYVGPQFCTAGKIEHYACVGCNTECPMELGQKIECPERETPELYGARLLWDMLERPEFYFARKEIQRLNDDLRDFQQELWSTQRTIRACELDQRTWGAAAWPRNTRQCNGGFSRCVFLDVCRGLCGKPDEVVPEGFSVTDVLHPELVNGK